MYWKSRATHSLRATLGEIPDPLSYAGELSPHCIPHPGTVVKEAHNMTMGVQLQLPEGERKAVSPAPLPMGLLPPDGARTHLPALPSVLSGLEKDDATSSTLANT